MNVKGLWKGTDSGLFDVLPRNFQGGTEEYQENLNQNSWYSNHDSNRVSPEYTTRASSFHISFIILLKI